MSFKQTILKTNVLFYVKMYCINIRFIQNPNIKGFFKNIDFEFGFAQKTISNFHTEKNLAKRIDLKIYNKINQSRHEKSFKTTFSFLCTINKSYKLLILLLHQ